MRVLLFFYYLWILFNMRVLLFFYYLWIMLFYFYSVINSQQHWLSSLIPTIEPLPEPNNILWLVSMADTCQGIILSPWWILSTASCLIKMKHLNSDMSIVIDQEGSILGQKICLHPRFDPKIGTNSAKGDIGLVLLQHQIQNEEKSLSYMHNMFWKSCYNCQYRHCRVFQYQNHNNSGTSITQLSVKLLDISFCHYQHTHLNEMDNLCIWSQLQEDCWVQQGSPVVCLFGNQWELVGLVSESAAVCHDPVLVIKTAPYLFWLRWLIKASQKSLDPILSLLCIFPPGERYHLQDNINTNSVSATSVSPVFSVLLKTRLDTLTLTGQHRNSFSILLVSSNKDSFNGNKQLYLQNSQVSSTNNFLRVQSWPSPRVKSWDTSDTAKHKYVPVADISKSWVPSGSQNFPTADMSKSDVMKYQFETETDLLQSQVEPSDDKLELQTIPLAGRSCLSFSNEIDGAKISSGITAIYSQIQSTEWTESHGQPEAKPWLQFATGGSWMHSATEQIETKKAIECQAQQNIDRIKNDYNPVTYNIYPWDNLLANKMEFWTPLTLNLGRSQYTIVTPTVEPLFQSLLNIVGDQEPQEKKGGYWIPSEHKSVQVEPFSGFHMPFIWNKSLKSWTESKTSMIKQSSTMDRIRPFNSLETTIIKSQTQNEYIPWLLTHPINDVTGPLVYINVDSVKLWAQPEDNVMHTWTQTETPAKKPLAQAKANDTRPWLQVQNERIKSWSQPQFQIFKLRTQTEEDKSNYWTQPEVNIIRYWIHSEIETIKLWVQPEIGIVTSWVQTNSDQLRPRFQLILKTAHTWVQPEAAKSTFWELSSVDTTKSWTKIQHDTLKTWIQAGSQTVLSWSQYEANSIMPSMKTQMETVKPWVYRRLHTINPWTRTQEEVDTFRPWTTKTDYKKSKDEMVSPWAQSAAGILKSWTKNEEGIARPWIQLDTDSTTFGTQPKIKATTSWPQTEPDRVRVWAWVESSAVLPWAQSEDDTVRIWTQDETPRMNTWTQAIVDEVIPWTYVESLAAYQWKHKIHDAVIPQTQNNWTQSGTDTLIPWIQGHYQTVMPWKHLESKTIILWTESKIPVAVTNDLEPWTHDTSQLVNFRRKSKTETVPLWTKAYSKTKNLLTGVAVDMDKSRNLASPAMKIWTEAENGTITPQINSEYASVTPWAHTTADIVTLWTQADSTVVNTQIQAVADTSTEWTLVDSSMANSYIQFENDKTTVLPKVESSLINSSTEDESAAVLPWTQADSLTIGPWIQPEADTGRIWTQLQTSVVNLRTDTIIDTFVSYTQYKSPERSSYIKVTDNIATMYTQPERLVLMPWEQTGTDIVIQYTQNEIQGASLWTQSENNIVTLRTQVDSPGINYWTQITPTVTVQTQSIIVNPWTQSQIDSVMLWIQDDSVSNTWTQSLVNTLTLWTLAINIWKEPSHGSTWTQAKYQKENPHTEIITDTHIPEAQFLSPTANYWEKSITVGVMPWTNAEYQVINPWVKAVTNILTLWTSVEIPGENPLTQVKCNHSTAYMKAETPAIDPSISAKTDKTITMSVLTEFLLTKPWTQAIADTVTLWTQSETPELNLWVQPKVNTIKMSVQTESTLVNAWKQPVAGKFIPQWLWPKFSVIKPWKQLINGTITQWTQADSIAVHPWIDIEVATGRSRTSDISPGAHVWTQNVINTITSLTLKQFPTVNSLTQTIANVAIQWRQHESPIIYPWAGELANLVSFWTQAETPIVTSWAQSITEIITQWSSPKEDIGDIKWTLVESSTINFLANTKTVSQWIQSGFSPVNLWTKPVYGSVTQWAWTDYLIINPWKKYDSEIVTPWTQMKTPALNTQKQSILHEKVTPGTLAKPLVGNLGTQAAADTVPFWALYKSNSAKLLSLSKINIFQHSFPFQTNTVQTSVQLESQISVPWIHSTIDTINSWAKPQTGNITQESGFWLQTESDINRFLSKTETEKIKFWNQPESQLERLTQTVRVGSSAQSEIERLISWRSPKTGIVHVLTQPERNMTKSCACCETDKLAPESQIKFSTVNPLIQSKINIIGPCAHSESQILKSWTQFPADTGTLLTYSVQIPLTLSGISTIRPWFQIQLDTTKQWTQSEFPTHWIYPEIKILSPQNHIEYDTFKPWTQPKADIAQLWIQSETRSAKLWTHSGVDTLKPLIQPEFQIIRTELGTTILFFQNKKDAVRTWFQPQSRLIHSCTKPEVDMSYPFTVFNTGSARACRKSETSTDQPIIQSETFTSRPWTQKETLTQFKSDVVMTYSFQTPVDSMRPWSQSELETVETEAQPERQRIVSPILLEGVTGSPWLGIQSDAVLLIKISPTESHIRMNSLQPSQLTNIPLLTHLSAWLPRRITYQNIGNLFQMTVTRGNPGVSFSPSFSFLNPCFHPSWHTLHPSCSVTFPYPLFFSSSCILSSCSVVSTMTFMPVILPLISFSNPSSEFNKKFVLSHAFSSLHDYPVTLLTKQPFLIPESQSETSPQQQHEQEPLAYSELSISLAECQLGMVWKESLQAVWIFNTTVVAHEMTACRSHLGLVPHCPDCWEAEVGEFPWLVSIQLSSSHFCAGSILNEQWILTAARCANFIKNSEALALVQVGLTDLQYAVQAQTVHIHRAIPYLGPKGPLGPGLIFLKQPMHFQPFVLPICLEENQEQKKSIQLYDCWLPSWSLMRGNPGILQKRHLSILKVSNCAQYWPKVNKFTFCIEAKKAMGEAGCKGDLGAPLLCHLQQKDTWVQVGILSHFDEHCTKPYVFSLVSPFLLWLQAITWSSHVPWSQQGIMTTSTSISLSVSNSTNTSTFISTPASKWLHFNPPAQPQTLAHRISLQYAMPWQAIIISCGSKICSGSIVSNSWVLTVAHCVRNMNPKDTAVILGLRHPETPLRVVKVSTILLHERFQLVNGTARNDLAMLLLQEAQTPIQLLAPLGHQNNLNSSECWLSGPLILKPGERDEITEMLWMKVQVSSTCAHLYPDIGTSIVCLITQSIGSNKNVEAMSPGSAVICKPVSGNGIWRQIGLTSLKTLVTILSPHFSWILSTSAKAGHPLNKAIMPWVDKPMSSSFLKEPPALSLSSIMIITIHSLIVGGDYLFILQ